MKFLKSFVLIISLLLTAALCTTAKAASVQIGLSSSNPGVGDMVYLKIRCVNTGGNATQPPSVPGFDVKFFTLTRQESAIKNVNGKTQSYQYKEYTVTLRATKEGHYSFGPISVGGVKSNTIRYSIGPKSKAQQPPRNAASTNPFYAQHAPVLAKQGGNDLFLRAEVSNPSPYEQEPVVYTVKFYSSYEGTQVIGSPSAPSFENCTFEMSDAIDHKFGHEVVGGKKYSTAVLMRYILYPTHSGTASIKGNTISFSVKQLMEYDDGSGSRIPIYQRGQVEAIAPEVKLNVKPLPQTDGRINGVGTYKVTSAVAKTNLTVNQVATVKYTVTGIGNPAFVSLPDMASVLPQELKFVKSESKITKSTTSTNTEGTVVFTVNIIPTKEGATELPPLKFRFFNPTTDTVYTADAAGCRLNVTKGSQSAKGQEPLTFDPQLQEVDSLSRTPQFLIDRRAYYIFFYVLPVVLLAAALVIYRCKVRISADVVGLRRKKAGKVAKSRLKTSAGHLRRNNAPAFYAEMLNALWGYMAQKLNIPLSELSRDNVSVRLEEAGVSKPLIEKVIDIIDRCEMARYTNSGTIDMKGTYDDASEAIDGLERSIHTKTATEVKKAENNNKNNETSAS